MELTEVLEARKHFNALMRIYKKHGYNIEQLKLMQVGELWNKLTQEIERRSK